MPLLPSVDEFLAAIELYQAGFRHTHFSYLAINLMKVVSCHKGGIYFWLRISQTVARAHKRTG